jgi:hypothetical protein
MSKPKPLDPQAVMKESLSMPGALGAIAYVVLKGLAAGGADDAVVGSVRVLMQEHFEQLSDGDCNVLCDVAYARLRRDAQKGKWY